MSLYEIDNTFIPPVNFNLNELSYLPTTNLKNDGKPSVPDPDSLFWLEYPAINKGFGTIGFIRFLYLGYPTIAEYVKSYLQQFFISSYELDIRRVAILRTVGNIGIHTDEGGRTCCLNLGLKNTDGATTTVSQTKNLDEYHITATEKICFDNHLYLLDTSNLHQVTARNNNPRYLFTYGFNKPFNEIKSLLTK